MVQAESFDFIVIGAGMAGASCAFELAAHARVLLIEREAQPGYHSTGRSAALYSETYGNATVRALTTGARPFFDSPPPGFAEHPLLTPRGALFIGTEEQAPELARVYEENRRLVPSVQRLSRGEILRMVPVIREEHAAHGVLEPRAMDIDVHALHQGYLRGLRTRGASLLTDAECLEIERDGGRWHVRTGTGRPSAAVLVDAAGAWADVVAGLAGVGPVGLVPKRRTAVTFSPPAGLDVHRWPMVIDAGETFYVKPDAGRLLASPADETPTEPSDVQPEELDIAVCIDRVETATTLSVRRVEHKWAGLRSFVADRTPVVGYDPAADGFFWLAGQGGYGIQTAPAMGRLSAALASGLPVPPDLRDLGITAEGLSPARLRAGGHGHLQETATP